MTSAIGAARLPPVRAGLRSGAVFVLITTRGYVSEGDPDKAPSPLDDLGERIAERRRDASRAAKGEDDGSKSGGQAGMALRAGSDFVAGVLVGALLGWGADRLFGTSPLFLTVFLLLGMAGGTLNAVRSTRNKGDGA